MTNSSVRNLLHSPRFAVAALVFLVALGAYLRLVRLDEYSLRADTINFWTICHSQLTARDIIHKWGELGLDHPPFTLVAIKWMIDTFHLPVTHAVLAVIPAAFGILCIPVMFLVGLRIGGRGFGLLLAGLLTLHPLHIQVSREPYHYSLLMLGSCMMLLGTIDAFIAVRDRREPGPCFFVATVLGMLGLTFSTFTGWSLAFIEGVAILGAFAWQWKKQDASPKALLVTTVLLGLLALPTLLSPWGITHFVGKMGGSAKELANRVMAGTEGSVWSLFRDIVMSFGWGATPLRLGFTVVVLVCAVVVIVKGRDRRTLYILCASLLVADIVVFLVSRSAINAGFTIRYVIVLLPIWVVMLGVGIGGWGQILPARAGSRQPFLVMTLLGTAAFLLYVAPSVACTRLRGAPVPYRDVQTWFNSNLPRGTLVLVDRWFEPWNELKVYNSTNVFFTFTIPNEPVDVYLKYNWRKTAERFFEKYPDAAYLELAKSYWEVPGVGPWDWPRQHFKQHVVLRNEAGLKLRDLGFLYRENGGIYTNRLIVEIFYNTREDIVAQARAAGRPVLALYGSGWGYIKLWQQMQDFRDWRVLESSASMDLYNFTTAPVTVEVVLRAVAISGSKKVRASNGSENTFTMNQLQPWNIGRLTLAPGLNQLGLSDALWSMGKSPLLVDDFTVSVVLPEAAAVVEQISVTP